MADKIDRIMIAVDCKNKAKKRTYAFEWNFNYKTLADGTDRFDGDKWLKQCRVEMLDRLRICSDHGRFTVKIKEDNKYSAATELNTMAHKFVHPGRDKITFKLEDTECDKDSCIIKRYAANSNSKKRSPPKQKRKAKRRKKRETSSDEEDEYSEWEDFDIDDNGDSTSSDEYDSSKCNKKKKKEKKKRKKKKRSPVLYGKFIETIEEKFGHLITMPGIVQMAEECFKLKKFPSRVPAHILATYGLKNKSFTTKTTHSNYNDITRSTRDPYIGHGRRRPVQTDRFNDTFNDSNFDYSNGYQHGHNNIPRDRHKYQYQYQYQPQNGYHNHNHHDSSLPPPVSHTPSTSTHSFPSPHSEEDTHSNIANTNNHDSS